MVKKGISGGWQRKRRMREERLSKGIGGGGEASGAGRDQ